jgi:hypothetical protein
MTTIEKIEHELNDIIRMYPNLTTKIEYIRTLILSQNEKLHNTTPPNLPYIEEPIDYDHPKNNPPLCLNRQRDYYEWIKECEEYEKNNPSK